MTATYATSGDTIRFVTHDDGTAHLMFRDPRTGWGLPIPMVAADPLELAATDDRPDSKSSLLALAAADAERLGARVGGAS